MCVQATGFGGSSAASGRALMACRLCTGSLSQRCYYSNPKLVMKRSRAFSTTVVNIFAERLPPITPPSPPARGGGPMPCSWPCADSRRSAGTPRKRGRTNALFPPACGGARGGDSNYNCSIRRPYPAKALTPHNNPKRIAIRASWAGALAGLPSLGKRSVKSGLV